MNRSHGASNLVRIAAAAAAALAMLPAVTGAQVIAPADAQASTGKTYGEWSAEWWQFVLSVPASDPNNPLLSATGHGCGAAQPRSGPVFFLAGSLGSDALTRNDCVVPAGKALFFPLVNAFNTHVPGDGLDTVELVWQQLADAFGPITSLFATVDDVPVAGDLFALAACAGGGTGCAADFSLRLTGNSVFVGTPARVGRHGAPWLRAGAYSPTVSIGYWVMLAPLPPGPHSIRFGGQGSFFGAPFGQDITYNIIVRP